MTSPVTIAAFYAFSPITKEALNDVRATLLEFGRAHDMHGLVLIAEEGINGTVCGSPTVIESWRTFLTEKFGSITFKLSGAGKVVFRRWSVKIKPEIVCMKKDGVRPEGKHRHLSPKEWQETLEREDVVLVDARNSYEYAIGKFTGAIDPGTEQFHQFPEAIAKAQIPKDKKVLMYCTGGIRCEKAIFAMEEQGYENVYQLDGGILAYLAQFPEKNFQGECFVFDHRVSVDQHLEPSQIYGLCPHCGDPGSEVIVCTECSKEKKVCTECLADPACKTCSKRCANEVRMEKKSAIVSVR